MKIIVDMMGGDNAPLAVLEGSGLRLRNCFLGKVVQSAFSLLLAALLVGYVLG